MAHTYTIPNFEFTVNTAQRPVVLRFPDDRQSMHVAQIQTGGFLNSPGQSPAQQMSHYYSWHWQRCENIGAWNVDSKARILDLGSGLSIIDLVAAKLLPDARFWLVDENNWTYDADTVVRHGLEHPYYNSWPLVHDLIGINDLDIKRFVLQPTDTAWPEELDLIISTWCWCWHLPLETYWPKVQQCLAIGGKLCVDIRQQHFSSMSEIISDAFGSEPVCTSYHSNTLNSGDVTGWRCVWQRQRR